MLRGLRLSGWMSLADVDLAISKPLVMFMGPNGAGKSGLRDAVTWAIAGRCRGVLHKKSLPDVVIRDGADRCLVGIMLPGLYVERSLTRGGQEALRLVVFEGAEKRELSGSLGELQAELYAQLGLDAGRAEAALDSWAFLSLDDEARTSLLFRALLGSASAEVIEGLLVDRVGAGPDVRRLAEIAASKGFRDAEKAAVALRQQKHRELHGLPEVQVAPRRILVGREERDLEGVALETFEKLLRDYRVERDRILRESGADVGAARQRVEALESAEQALAETAYDGSVRDLGAIRVDRTKAHEAVRVASENESEAGTRIAELDAEIARAQALVEVAEIEKPTICPAIPGEFSCPATSAKLEAHAKKLRERAATAAQALAETERLMQGAREALGAAIQQREAAEAAVKRLADEYRSAEAEIARRERDERELARIRTELKAARAALAEAEATASAGSGTAFIDGRIGSVEKVVTAKKAWEAYKADTTKDRREQLTQEHRAADALVKTLEPGGVEADLVREALVPVRERLATTGKMLGEVTIDDDLVVRAVVDGKRRRYEQLSRSQQLRLGIAMQDAIASASGLPVLLVDELDVFKGGARGAVLGVLRCLVGNPYGSVIGFATETAPPKGGPPELGLYWLADGKVESVG